VNSGVKADPHPVVNLALQEDRKVWMTIFEHSGKGVLPQSVEMSIELWMLSSTIPPQNPTTQSASHFRNRWHRFFI